jgi:hypothetical protein
MNFTVCEMGNYRRDTWVRKNKQNTIHRWERPDVPKHPLGNGNSLAGNYIVQREGGNMGMTRCEANASSQDKEDQSVKYKNDRGGHEQLKQVQSFQPGMRHPSNIMTTNRNVVDNQSRNSVLGRYEAPRRQDQGDQLKVPRLGCGTHTMYQPRRLFFGPDERTQQGTLVSKIRTERPTVLICQGKGTKEGFHRRFSQSFEKMARDYTDLGQSPMSTQ